MLCFIVVYFTVGIWRDGHGIVLGFINATAMVLGLNSPFIYLTYRKHRSGYIFLIAFGLYMAQGQTESQELHIVYGSIFVFTGWLMALTMICCSISEIRILNLQKKDSLLKLGKLILDIFLAGIIWIILLIFAIIMVPN